MAIHTESPRAKIRREQAFRNVLAARRRKIVRQRNTMEATVAASTLSSSVVVRTSPKRRRQKPVLREAMVGDLLEMQESQNGIYLTVPEQNSFNETQEIVIRTLGSTGRFVNKFVHC